MLGILREGWRCMSWVEVRALGLTPPYSMEDANVMVKNTETGEVLNYPDYSQKYDTQGNLALN